jgi:hypothetical protein
MGCELKLASDDVRSAKAEKQQLLRFDGAAQQRERRGGESEWISGDACRQRTTGQWIDGLLFG